MCTGESSSDKGTPLFHFPLLFLYKLSAVKPQMKDHTDEKPSF